MTNDLKRYYTRVILTNDPMADPVLISKVLNQLTRLHGQQERSVIIDNDYNIYSPTLSKIYHNKCERLKSLMLATARKIDPNAKIVHYSHLSTLVIFNYEILG